MLRFLTKRVAHALLVLWAAFTLSFTVLFVLPGDPVALMLGTEQMASLTPAELAELRHTMGTDQPFLVQYGDQLWRALHLDLGQAYSNGVGVTQILGEAAPKTIALAAASLALGVAAGVAIAVLANLTRSGLVRGFLLTLPPLGVSLPTFWVGLMLLQIFSFQLGWFPAFGERTAATLVLPTVTLAVPISAATAQVLNKSLSATIREPYADVLRAKGVGPLRILFAHGLRNASLPALTTVGVMVAGLLGGSVLTETVFSRNGLGQVAAVAVGQKDIPVVQGVVLLAALIFVVVSLAVDILYTVLDPRIKLHQEAS
ncbi:MULTISPECIES: ABC transporter permease [unclassified Pseudarthrobacter]|uniref:ABC transporter permease n=1 Tax=unclassified Pseudarthrobacter TaxID=2647000 RepID=UPI003624B84A